MVVYASVLIIIKWVTSWVELATAWRTMCSGSEQIHKHKLSPAQGESGSFRSSALIGHALKKLDEGFGGHLPQVTVLAVTQGHAPL